MSSTVKEINNVTLNAHFFRKPQLRHIEGMKTSKIY